MSPAPSVAAVAELSLMPSYVPPPVPLTAAGGGGGDRGGQGGGGAEQTIELLRTQLREIVTRQIYHSIFVVSAADDHVATHLRSLSSITPSHLGVTKALCLPSLWTAAANQLKRIDSIATPAAGLRCVMRSWDALLGVLGVWSKHAQVLSGRLASLRF